MDKETEIKHLQALSDTTATALQTVSTKCLSASSSTIKPTECNNHCSMWFSVGQHKKNE